MPLRSYDDATTIAALRDACRDIAAFLKGTGPQSFLRDSLVISAVCFKLAVLGEATTQLSERVQARFPQVSWKEIRATRNHLIHGYDRIDLDEIWRTSTLDVPVLLDQLMEIQEQLNSAR